MQLPQQNGPIKVRPATHKVPAPAPAPPTSKPQPGFGVLVVAWLKRLWLWLKRLLGIKGPAPPKAGPKPYVPMLPGQKAPLPQATLSH